MSQRRGGVIRRKSTYRPNRYNPNAPDYRAVHSAAPRLGMVSPLGWLSVVAFLSRRRQG